MPANNVYSLPTIGATQDLDLPSGGKVQVRSIEIEDLIEMDILDQMDALGATVQTDHIERVRGTKKPSDRQPKKLTKAEQEQKSDAAVFDLMKDKKKFAALKKSIDRVVSRSVIQPKVALAYTVESTLVDGTEKIVYVPHDDSTERDDSLIWTDQLQFTDKMHIFGAVLPGGDELKSFREGSGEAVGDLADQPEA